MQREVAGRAFTVKPCQFSQRVVGVEQSGSRVTASAVETAYVEDFGTERVAVVFAEGRGWGSSLVLDWSRQVQIVQFLPDSFISGSTNDHIY